MPRSNTLETVEASISGFYIRNKPKWHEWEPRISVPGSLWQFALDKGKRLEKLWEFDFDNGKVIGRYLDKTSPSHYTQTTVLSSQQEIKMFIEEAGNNATEFRSIDNENWQEYNSAISINRKPKQ